MNKVITINYVILKCTTHMAIYAVAMLPAPRELPPPLDQPKPMFVALTARLHCLPKMDYVLFLSFRWPNQSENKLKI